MRNSKFIEKNMQLSQMSNITLVGHIHTIRFHNHASRFLTMMWGKL